METNPTILDLNGKKALGHAGKTVEYVNRNGKPLYMPEVKVPS